MRRPGSFAILFTVALASASTPSWAQPAHLVKDVTVSVEPAASLRPTAVAQVGGTLYFAGTSEDNESELWKVGPGGEPVRVKTFTPPPHSLAIATGPASNLTPAGSLLFFIQASRLWRSDGTEAGTFALKDVTPFGSHDAPLPTLAVLGGVLLFSGREDATGVELW